MKGRGPQAPTENSDPAASLRREAGEADIGERLPLGIKLAYGMPNLAGAAMVIPIAIHMNIFYSDVVLLPLGYIALAVAVARAFDAITDPLMGWISDRTRTRWGRRRPWMFVGAPLCAVAFVLLFSPPRHLTGSPAAAWFTTAFLLYFLFHTAYSIPHYGLGPELTLDYKERSSLFAWMEGFTLIGMLCAAALPGLVLIPRYGERTAYTFFAMLFGGVLILLYWWQCYRIRERPEFYERQSNPLVPGIRRVLRNRPFRILLATYLAVSVVLAIPGMMIPYFTTYVLQPEEPQRWIGIFLLTYFAAAFLALPPWLRAVRRWGKKPIYIVSCLMAVVASLALFFQGEGDLAPTFGILVWAGASFGVRTFLGPSIQADVIDYDELYTGKRREAQYGSLWAIMVKFAIIPSAAIPLAILSSLGYQPNVEQSDTVKLAIRAIFGLGPATFGGLSLLIFCWFPINERIHRAILAGIERHRSGEYAEDPLTGRNLAPPAERGVDEESSWFLDHFSERELRRALARGAGVLVRSAQRAALVSLAICALGVSAVVPELGDLSKKPAFPTVLAVMVSGFALSAFLYHLIRLRAARQLRIRPLGEAVVRSHLAVTASLAQSSVRND